MGRPRPTVYCGVSSSFIEDLNYCCFELLYLPFGSFFVSMTHSPFLSFFPLCFYHAQICINTKATFCTLSISSYPRPFLRRIYFLKGVSIYTDITEIFQPITMNHFCYPILLISNRGISDTYEIIQDNCMYPGRFPCLMKHLF